MEAERRRTASGAIALVVLFVAALAVYGLDQLSKYLVVTHLVEGEAVQVIGDLLHWQFVRDIQRHVGLMAMMSVVCARRQPSIGQRIPPLSDRP